MKLQELASKNYHSVQCLKRGLAEIACFSIKNSVGMAVARHQRVVGRARAGSTIKRGVSTMNWDRLQGHWKQMSGKIKQHWGRYTDDALREIEGRREELAGKIQEAYGISRDDAGRQARFRQRMQ